MRNVQPPVCLLLCVRLPVFTPQKLKYIYFSWFSLGISEELLSKLFVFHVDASILQTDCSSSIEAISCANPLSLFSIEKCECGRVNMTALMPLNTLPSSVVIMYYTHGKLQLCMQVKGFLLKVFAEVKTTFLFLISIYLSGWNFCCHGWSLVSMKDARSRLPTMHWLRSTSTATTHLSASWRRTHSTTAPWLESTARRETPTWPVWLTREGSATWSSSKCVDHI